MVPSRNKELLPTKMESRTQRRSLSGNLLPRSGSVFKRSNHNLFYGGGYGSNSTIPYSHYLSSILNNKETRNVFFFLVLNISFCFVEFLYGFWSNSLGLTTVCLCGTGTLTLLLPDMTMTIIRMLFICYLILLQLYFL